MFMHHAPLSSWPGLSRPSIRPRTREEAWRREMPGYPDTRNQSGQVRARPGMTRRVGRSDGSHPQGRRRPQPAPPLHQPFLIPQAPGAKLIISLRRRALTPFAWLRAYARGAVAPSGPLRSPVPVMANASSGAARGVCYQGVRAAGPERATARRAEWRVSQASGARARR